MKSCSLYFFYIAKELAFYRKKYYLGVPTLY